MTARTPAPGYAEHYPYDDDLDEEDEMEWIDCGLTPDGQCAKAGSEECDWECPHSRGEFFAGSDLWNKKHNADVPVDGCQCQECFAARIAKMKEPQDDD